MEYVRTVVQAYCDSYTLSLKGVVLFPAEVGELVGKNEKATARDLVRAFQSNGTRLLQIMHPGQSGPLPDAIRIHLGRVFVSSGLIGKDSLS